MASDFLLKKIKPLEGRRITVATTASGHFPGEEWIVLVLDDGTTLTVSSDWEGNGPGALFIDAPKRKGKK